MERNRGTDSATRSTALLGGVCVVLILCLLFGSARLRGLLANTALLIVGTWSVCLPVGTLLALCLAKTTITGRRLIERLLIVVLFLPLFIQTTAWQAAVGHGGWLVPEGVNLLQGWVGTIWVHGVAAVPWVVLFVAITLRSIPRELEEESLQDAASLRVLWRVSLRRSVVSVVAAALWVAVLCAGEIAVTDVFRIRTFAEEVYTSANLGSLQDLAAFNDLAPLVNSDLWWGTLALTCVLVMALLAIASWTRSLSSNSHFDNENWRMDVRRPSSVLGAWLLIAVVLGVPLSGLLGKSGMEAYRTDGQTVRSWSPAKTAQLTAASIYEHRRELGWTAVISGSAALGATGIAILSGWLLRIGKLPVAPLALLLALGFAVPGPLLGIWTIQLFNHNSDSLLSFLTWFYDHTVLAVVLVQLVRAVPLATLIVASQLATISDDVLDSAASDGAQWWQQLWAIALPLRWKSVVVAAIVSLIVAVGDLAATLLVLPPGVSTVSVRVFGLIHYGAEDRVSAFCLMLTILLGGVSMLAGMLIPSESRRATPT